MCQRLYPSIVQAAHTRMWLILYLFIIQGVHIQDAPETVPVPFLSGCPCLGLTQISYCLAPHMSLPLSPSLGIQRVLALDMPWTLSCPWLLPYSLLTPLSACRWMLGYKPTWHQCSLALPPPDLNYTWMESQTGGAQIVAGGVGIGSWERLSPGSMSPMHSWSISRPGPCLLQTRIG